MTARCLSTRATPEGFKRRRYAAADGTRLTTIEVPLELWEPLDRTPERWAAVKAQALALVAAGEARKTVASALSVSYRSIQRWTKR